MTSGRTGLDRCWCRCAAHVHRVATVGFLLGAVVLSFCFSSSSFADSPGDSRAYQVGPGDRLAVTVFGQPELSGDVLVDGAGNILLPLIGAIQVKDLTILDCQNLVRDRLAEGVLQQPFVSVRISELRPMYVLGDVRTPGAYAFRYGSTVQSAVAVAGGFAVPPLGEGVAMSEYLLADERVRQLSVQKQALLVRHARLEAQRDGMKTFSPPVLKDDDEAAGSAAHETRQHLSSAVADESDIFEMQGAVLRDRLNLLHSQKPRLGNEIEAFNGQIAAAKKQLDVLKQHADQYTRLVKQGLGVINAELQFRVTEANQESELWRLTTQVLRLQMEAGELDLKVNDAEAAFKQQVMTELREVRDRLRELEATLPSAREIREVKLQQVGNGLGSEAPRSLTITRTRIGQAVRIDAIETTALEPGDIIDVKKPLPRDLRYQRLSASEADLRPLQRHLQNEDKRWPAQK
jgi:polysaccharide export outer membrane protein